MSSKAKILVKGSILRVVEFFLSALVGIALMPFIIHSLGDKHYGLWIFVSSFLGYYGLLEFGLNVTVQRFISKAIGAADFEDVNKVVNTALFVFFIIGSIVLILSCLVALIIPMVIKNISEIDTFRIIILILGLSSAIGFPMRVFSGVLTANIRYDLSAVVEIIKLLSRALLIVIFLRSGSGIIALAFITFITEAGGYGIKYLLMRYFYNYVKISRKYIDKQRIKSFVKYSVYAFISQIANQLRFNVDNLVITSFIGLNAVTLYSIGARLVYYAVQFIFGATGMTMPIFSQYEGAKDYNALREKFLFLTKITSYLTIFIGGTLIIFGKAFITRWVGVKYMQSYDILLLLLIPSMLDMVQYQGVGVLFGVSKHKFLAILSISEGITNLILSIILVKHFGIYGVAIGTAIPMIINKLIFQPVYTCKVIGLSYRKFYLKFLLPLLFFPTVFLYLFWLVIKGFITAQYPNILLLVFVHFIAFGTVIYLLGFNTMEKKSLYPGIFGLR